jgi:hypothetical protein
MDSSRWKKKIFHWKPFSVYNHGISRDPMNAMRETCHLAGIAVCGCVLILPSPAHAEEGGSGHYLPGSMSSFMDSVPTGETVIARLNALHYDGSFAKDLVVPIAGLRAGGVDAESFAAGLTLLWRPPVDLGENWSYAMSATAPWVWMDVSANIEVMLPGGGPASIRRSDSVDGLGDIVLMPLMLNYKATEDFSGNFRLGIYAPTGDYEVGRLANPGKNYWTIEPTLALMYFGQKTGLEASLFTGLSINSGNDDTDYNTGNQFHVDGTLAQHFPLAGGLAGLGINGFWYEQVTGDSGSGANFGKFEARTAGLGPALSYKTKLGGHDLIAEAKWLHEMETEKRLEGDYFWLKVIVKF